jgi:4-alpha-glucanotransferase
VTNVPSTPHSSSIERLAAFAGIMTEYEDVFGERQVCPERSLRAILAAMGFDASSAESASAALQAAEAAACARVLEPIYVARAGTPPELTMTVPARAQTLDWTLVAEGGAISAGASALTSVPSVEATVDGVTYARRSLALPEALAPGYYRFSARAQGREYGTTIAVVPDGCYLPPEVAAAGVWGLAVQLYALRSKRGPEIGNFTDLARLCETVAAAGGAAVGINPLHELTFARDAVASPYCPSSRLFLNWIYLDVEALPGFERDESEDPRGGASAPELIDYQAVAASKRAVAERAYGRFYDSDIVAGTSEPARSFAAFVRDGGSALRSVTVFDALSDHFARSGAASAWQTWPPELHDPASPGVERFVAGHVREIEFFAYLQWQADVQLAAVAASGSGLRIGLYRDLAVGANLGGADTWAQQATLRANVTVGAPPDILNRSGQAWGVAPFDPLALRAAAYEPFIALLRANMRHAGALRIDHVMALARLYWVPENADASEGTYVMYRLDELLGIISLESRRARCMVIGEDLGTVPDGFRERLRRACVLSYRLLEFEQDDERFFAPQEYPELALVSTGTHDLPSIGAYWTAHDVDVRAELGLFEDEAAAALEREERAKKRVRLLAALRSAGLPEADVRRFDDAAARPDDRETLAEIALWANRFLARSPSRLLMVQLEDLLGDVEPINIPATTDEHPNWRRRTSIALEDLATDSRFIALAAALRRDRGSA